MDSPSRSSSPKSPNGPSIAGLVAYRLGETLVYVKPVADYEEALDIAIAGFPAELENIPRHLITLNIQATMNKEKRGVQISKSSWLATVARMIHGEVIDIVVVAEKRRRGTAAAPRPYPEQL